MDNEILRSLIGSLVTLLVAAGGWIFAYILHRDEKSQARIKARVERLEAEVKARIFLEEEACDWLAELTSRSAQSIKLDLRKRSENRLGSRPKMSRADF
jgi:hypothetical protein